MILSDITIREHLKYHNLHGTITAEPKPTEEQIQPASLDVRLGEEIYHFDFDRSVKREKHKLYPGQRYLGHTKETIDLPKDIAAQLAGRSSIGRQGVIVHKTAGWIDPGFTGEITLELMNLGKEPVVLDKDQRVAQLVFFRVDRKSEGYEGHYQNQTGATKNQT